MKIEEDAMGDVVMNTREVPRADWMSFFEKFSRRHWNAKATLAVLDRRIGAQVEAHALPLEGISCEPDGRSILMMLGRGSNDHVEHPVFDPRKVWLEVTERGREAALDIESMDGTKTILELEQP